MSTTHTYGPYELANWIHATLPPPRVSGIRTRAGQETGVRVGAHPPVARLPGEEVWQMCLRAAEMHGTALPFALLYG